MKQIPDTAGHASALIRSRRSVRTFDGAPLPPDTAARILEYAETSADNPFGIPVDWRILDAEADGLTSPVIVGARTWIAGKTDPVPHAEEAFGYSFETLLLYAQSLGLGSVIIAGTMDRPAFERAAELEPGRIMPCVSPLGIPADRMSLRETMMRKGIRADTRMEFSSLFFDGSLDVPLMPERAERFREPLELARLAPSAVNKQPWRAVRIGNALHFYEKRAKGYVSSSGWDIQKIDMGIALCHCVLGLEEAGLSPGVTVSDPGLPLPPDTLYIATVTI